MPNRRRLASFLVNGSTRRNGAVDDGSAFPESFATTRIADAINWARKYSFFPYPFVTACCGMEYFSVAGPRYDIDRFGAALPRFTPRQADLLFVVGTITQRQAPILKRVYDQMAEPKWVVSFGACTSSGGPYDNYAVLQAMLDAGLDIPHYCYHPKLSIDGSCRLCQVKIEGIPKLQISCNTQVRDGMVVHTQDDEVALTRRGVLELLLMNHPLDCPIFDKAGECWLQNYAMRFSGRFGRTLEPRRKREKRIDIGDRMLLDQERCILCRRCVRFCREISQTAELAVFNAGDRSVLDIHAGQRLNNDYSMCTADVCPVGALETKDFHHKLRVWFLAETASVCPGCSNGCNIMISEYKNRIWRLTPRRNDAVNDTWMCDAGRLNYKFVGDKRRVRTPLIVRDGAMVETDWMTAIARAG